MSYGYDSAGRRTSITYPGTTGVVDYGYDDANRLTSVTDWLSQVTSYSYDDANRLTSTTLGNGLISDRTYDDANRLLSITNRDGGTTISSYTYTLDDVGNRSQVVDTSGTTTYGYDDLYRLTGVTYQNSDTQTYSYDEMGNRETKVENGSNTTNYTYDDADEMTAAGGVSYSYDDNGNQVAAGSDTYGWDGENRLTSTSIGGVTGTYTYNGAGVRMSRAIGASSVSYVWDLTGSLPNVLQDSDGNSYVYGLDLISKTDAGGSQEYYLTDGLGSTTAITDGTGAVTGTYAYDVFGAVRAQTGVTTEWSYTGEQNDPNGLEFLRARYYEAQNGRFISRDPLPLIQRYTYANNNPASLIDPSGLFGTAAGLAKAQAQGGLALIRYTSQVILESACWLASGGKNCKAILAWQADVLKLGRRVITQGARDCVAAARRFASAGIVSAISGCEIGIAGRYGYVDANVTACIGIVVGPCGSIGFQWNWRQGVHGYWGGGLGVVGASASVSWAPGSSITPGQNCSAGGFFGAGIGAVGQYGAALDTVYPPFGEVGLGVGSWSGNSTCVDVQR